MLRAFCRQSVSSKSLVPVRIHKWTQTNAVWLSRSVNFNFEDTKTSPKEGVSKELESSDLRNEGSSKVDSSIKASLPFFVSRSRTGNLPVYTDYKHGRKTVLTQIRKIDGDIMAMERMLREELQEPKLHSRVDEITKSITLHGKYRKKVAQWLEKFGF